jgi:hypothetical protein
VKAGKKLKKSFDSVASKRKAQSRIYRKIRGMTPAEEAAYFEMATRSGPFAKMWQELVAKGRKAPAYGRLSSHARRTA